MTSLADVAKQYREAKLATAGHTEQQTSEDDLQAQIDERLQQSIAQAAKLDVEPEQAEREADSAAASSSVVDRATPVEESGGGEWEIPAPVTRALGGRKRVPIELPISFEPLRLEAKDRGMASGHLLLAAMHAHTDELFKRANDGLYQTTRPRGFTKQWQLMWHETERAEFDEVVDQMADYLPRRSRAHVAALLLELCQEGEASTSQDRLTAE